MCIYTLLNYHTPCHHLCPTRTYHPPQHCLPVKAALFHYHDQVNQLPRPVPLPMPKICPPVWKRWWEGGNVWVGEVGWRCGVCEDEEEKGARDSGGCEGVVGNRNGNGKGMIGNVKGMMGEYFCRVWQGQGQGERVSTTTMMMTKKKKTKKGGKGRRNNRNDPLFTTPRQQQPPFTSMTTATASDDDSNKSTTCAVKPPRNGPIIATSPEVVSGAFYVQGATLAEVPGMLDEAGRQGWKILKLGASMRWEYEQGMVWKDVVF